MESFDKVSLGFAEFVSQLLRETFDAAIFSQNHQIEQYAQLEKSLNLSNDKFYEQYITHEALHEREIEVFGRAITPQSTIDENFVDLVKIIFTDIKGILHNKKITINGAKIIKNFLIEEIVDEKKAAIQLLINQSESARLVIDSGEIKAKLELSNYSRNVFGNTGINGPPPRPNLSNNNNSQPEELRRNSVESPEPAVDDSSLRETMRETRTAPMREGITSHRVKLNGIEFDEVSDPATKMKTILINKDSIISNKPSLLPVRVIAKPVSGTSNSNLYSEVTIKFKMV